MLFHGEDLQLKAEIGEVMNEKYSDKAIVLKNIHTLEGVFIQYYLVIRKFEDFLYLQELNHGAQVEFTGNVFSKFSNRILLPRGFRKV